MLEVIVSDQCQYDAITHHKEGFDFILTNNRLAAIELTLANLENKEIVLKNVVAPYGITNSEYSIQVGVQNFADCLNKQIVPTH